MGLKPTQVYFDSDNLRKPPFKFRLKVRSDTEAQEVKGWFLRAFNKFGGMSRPTYLVLEYPKIRKKRRS